MVFRSLAALPHFRQSIHISYSHLNPPISLDLFIRSLAHVMKRYDIHGGMRCNKLAERVCLPGTITLDDRCIALSEGALKSRLFAMHICMERFINCDSTLRSLSVQQFGFGNEAVFID